MGRHNEELEAERTYELIKREKENSGTWVKSFLKFLFSQVGLVILSAAIAVVGANIYIGIETPYEKALYAEKQKVARKIESSADYLAAVFWSYVKDYDLYNYTYPQFEKQVDSDLRSFISFIVDAAENNDYDGTVDGWDTWWTFPKSLMFTITLMTTVGYGYTFPRTLSGQMFTLIYTVLAVGANFAMLTNVGGAFAEALTYTYSRVCCRWFRNRRVVVEIPSRGLRKRLRRRLVDEDVGDELFMPTNTIPIPIIVNIVIMFSYIAIGAFIFSKWEGWDVASGAYFSFITLLTIGFGDMVPIVSFSGVSKPDATGNDYFKLIFAIFYSAIGVALISMCVSLIQEQAARSAALAMGLQKEVIEMDVVVIVERRRSFGKEEKGFEEPLEVVTVESIPSVVPVPMSDPTASSPLPGTPDDDGKEEETEEEEDDDEEEEEEKKEEENKEEKKTDEEEEESDDSDEEKEEDKKKAEESEEDDDSD